MNKLRIVLLGIVVFAAACPVVSGAPGDKGSWEFGPYVGAVLLDKYGALDPDNEFIGGGRLGFFMTPHISLEGAYQVLSTEARNARSRSDFDLDSSRLNGLWNFREGKAFRPFATIGVNYDSLDVSRIGSSDDFGGNAGVGARWILSDIAAVRLDGRYVYHNLDIPAVPDGHQDNVELTAGLSFMMGGGPPKDSDRDGVRDSRDKCPDTPMGATVDEHGCPKDSDGDGVLDGIDACPDTPHGWPVDARGCPLDTDGDGVPDGKDRCPDTPRGARVDADGCPIDSDGDGVYDGIDTCPDTPKGCKVDAKGCPLDSDGDGVIDCSDKCPGTPRGVKVDADGCPPKAAVFPENKKELILEGVHFETDKWDITPGSMETLDRVAASLKDWPDVRVELQGHTDSSGGAAHNLQLSEKRANAVRDYLISKGVAESQVTAKGYGETQPIADNTTKEGKAQNRRTAMVKIE